MINLLKNKLLPLTAALNLAAATLPAKEPVRIIDSAPAVSPDPAIVALNKEFRSPARGVDIPHTMTAERLTPNGMNRDIVFSSSAAVKIALLVERKAGQGNANDEISLYAQNPKGQWQPVLMSFKLPAGAPASVGETDISNTNGVFCIRMPASIKLTGLRTLSLDQPRARIDPKSLGFPAQPLVPTIATRTTTGSGSPNIIPLEISPAAPVSPATKLNNGVPPTTSGSNIKVESRGSGNTASGAGAQIGGITVDGVQIK